MRRTATALAIAGALLGTMSATGMAKPRAGGVTVPPVCVRHALPGGLALQVGYCPSARR